MSNTVATYPSFVQTTTEVYGHTWSNPDNIKASDTACATTYQNHVGSYAYSCFMIATNFGFAIPAGATINGIEVEINAKRVDYNTPPNYAKDYRLSLTRNWNGAAEATDYASATEYPTTAATRTYGGPTDLWGSAWSAAEINGINFGIGLSSWYYSYNSKGTIRYSTAYVDFIRMTVYYTESSTPPTVTTTTITNISSSGLTSGGNVTSDGGDPVTERGVCYSTSPSPTTGDTHTSDGSGTGEFVSEVTGLTSSTPYYIRAYATNSVATSYGEEVSGTTTSGNISRPQFWRSHEKTEESFVDMVNRTTKQSFTTGNEAKTWLNNNGYWTSWE